MRINDSLNLTPLSYIYIYTPSPTPLTIYCMIQTGCNGGSRIDSIGVEKAACTTQTDSSWEKLNALFCFPCNSSWHDQAGFNAGNGMDYVELDGAQTAAVLNLTLTSNVGVSGKWILRVDSRSNLNPCATSGEFYTHICF